MFNRFAQYEGAFSNSLFQSIDEPELRGAFLVEDFGKQLLSSCLDNLGHLIVGVSESEAVERFE